MCFFYIYIYIYTYEYISGKRQLVMLAGGVSSCVPSRGQY